MLNRRFFFDQVRQSLFDGRLRQSQVRGLTAILDAWEALPDREDDRRLAYVLATAHHETDRALWPVREAGGAAYLTRRYDIGGERPADARRHGNTLPGDGVRYAGRGFVQLTWKANYARAGAALGVNLVDDPDRALDLTIATRILIAGMREGWFTGRRLADCFAGPREEWVAARRIINGLDKANLIAGFGRAYYAALSHTA